MNTLRTLSGLLDQWVTVTHPDAPDRVWQGRLTEVWDQWSIVLETPGGGRETFPASFTITPTTEPQPGPAGDKPRTWADFRNSGMLWLINRVAFHPRGLALALHYGPTGDPYGWSLLQNEDGEPWQFDPATDDDGFRRAEATLAAALHPARLLSCGLCYEENGEEVHPHPECTIGSTRPPVDGRTHLVREQLVEQTKPDPAVPCCVCGGGPVVYDNYKGQLFCWRCADCDCGRDGPCIRTGLHRPAKPWTCTATYREPFHGFARCERHPADRDDLVHEGTSQDGSRLYWNDRMTGATPHCPDTVRTPRPDPDTTPRTPADTDTDTPALTSADTVRTACPDTGPDSVRTGEPDTAGTACPDGRPDSVRTVWTASVPRRQMGPALAEALRVIARGGDQDQGADPAAADEEPAPSGDDLTLGPDGLTDVERERKTIRDALNAELSHDEPDAVWTITLAVSRALHAMPRYGHPTRSPADLAAAERECRTIREAVARIKQCGEDAALHDNAGTSENALARLALARAVLVEDGYFADDEVGPDLAPRLVEWLVHHRGLTDQAQKEVEGLRSRVGELAETLADTIACFTVPALVDGRAHLRTRDIPVTTVEGWRRVHTGRSHPARTFPEVAGICPTCRRDGLYLGSGGCVTCSHDDCPRPEAATTVLDDPPSAAHTCNRPDCLDLLRRTVEAHRRASLAYEWLRCDVITAVAYLRQQQRTGILSPLHHTRSRVLATLPTWIKDPGPLTPVDPEEV